ncbi:MAG TPA: DUF3014 domain-containing protein [Methyloprofundus sp.]|uniref:DUF3014 domain-containing protein n=1 Tax=Methyloprofundus sp. TaxID=2020875 RepID=UPI00179BBC65|nr:DUF3014 domain-containing protein [Methyloprofundus sp.]HIG65646.1 DUF3014 domain-containing protein [Methyloprofundus sp.]HIL78592.1 DUF3014 domain-containing protein [Methylococcales bacterium]
MQDQNIHNSNKSTVVMIGIVIVLLIVALLLFLLADKDDASSNLQGSERVLLIPEVESQSELEISLEGANENLGFASQLPRYDDEGLQFQSGAPLPELTKSDTKFSQDVLSISVQLQAFLFKRQVIRKSVFSINDIAEGMRPPVKRLRELFFSKPFTVTQVDDKMYISKASYRRYDQLAQALNSIDNQAAVDLYQKYLPLFQQVFVEFSYPQNYQVLDIMKAATAKILDVPIISGKIEVIRPTVRYKFANPKLEKLSALDKQMLRMGPENTRLIQNKLRKLVEALIVSEKE